MPGPLPCLCHTRTGCQDEQRPAANRTARGAYPVVRAAGVAEFAPAFDQQIYRRCNLIERCFKRS